MEQNPVTQKPGPYYKAVSDADVPRPGDVMTVEDASTDPALSGPEMLCFTSLLGAVRYQSLTTRYCQVTPLEVIASDSDSIRCRSARVIEILDPQQMDRLAGFKLMELNLPRDPLTRIPAAPVDAVLPHLPEWVKVRSKLRGSVEACVENSTREYGVQKRVEEMLQRSGFGGLHYPILASMGIALEAGLDPDGEGSYDVEAIVAHVDVQMTTQYVRDSVRDAVWAYVGGLFPGTTRWADAVAAGTDDVEDMLAFLFSDPAPREWKPADELGPDPWRPLLSLWYAGYVPTFDGALWRLHTGPDADVVWAGVIEGSRA